MALSRRRRAGRPGHSLFPVRNDSDIIVAATDISFLRTGRLFGSSRERSQSLGQAWHRANPTTALLRDLHGQPAATQRARLHAALRAYQGDETRRDDVSAIGLIR